MDLVRLGELHPLQNPLILDNIFTHLPVNSLKECRQVSKLWCNSSMKAWKSSVRIGISNWKHGKTMADYHAFYDELRTLPFETLSAINNYSVHEDCRRFWSIHGAQIKVLSLYFIRFESTDSFLNIIFNQCVSLEHLTLGQITTIHARDNLKNTNSKITVKENKNLKSLTLNYMYKTNSIPWNDFLSRVPNLTEITLGGRVLDADLVFEIINRIRNDCNNKLNLNRVDTANAEFSQNPPELIRTLKHGKLKLIYLAIRIHCIEETNAIRGILSTHAKTLEKLSVKAVSRGRPLFGSFHELMIPNQGNFENLQEIEFFAPVFNSLNFLKFTPSLKKLRLNIRCAVSFGNFEEESSGYDASASKCTEFRIKIDSHVVGTDSVYSLVQWMPNLETLEIPLNNEQFSIVCNYLPNLENLYVLSKGIDDCAITGLDWEDVEEINSKGESNLWRPITVPRANITGLKQLRRFRMSGLRGFPRNLGVCAALFGILLMNKLEQLQISNYELDGSNWDTLRTRFGWSEDLSF